MSTPLGRRRWLVATPLALLWAFNPLSFGLNELFALTVVATLVTLTLEV